MASNDGDEAIIGDEPGVGTLNIIVRMIRSLRRQHKLARRDINRNKITTTSRYAKKYYCVVVREKR